MRRRFVFLSAGLLIACNTSGTAPAITPDASTRTPTCGELDLMDLTLSEGGSAELAFRDDGIEVSASAGLVLGPERSPLRFYAGYGVAPGQTLTLRRSGCEDASMAVSVRPLEWTVLTQWDPATAGPPAREYGSWWITDEGERDGLYVLGGFHYVPRQFTPASDLWFFDFDAERWDEIETDGAPVAPGSRASIGPTPGTVFVHGGATIEADGSLDTPPMLEVLHYGDGTHRWEAAPHATASPGSYTGAFFYDPIRERWLSVCGVDSRFLGIHCSVSEYTPERGWNPVNVEGPVPAGRFGFHYAYDQVTDRLFVIGGQAGQANSDVVGDTWALELGDDPPGWEQLFANDESVRRRNGAYVLDPIGRRIILWGGTADGAAAQPGISALRIDRGQERWDHLQMPDSIPPRSSGLAAYDAERQRAIVGFGNGDDIYTDLYALSL